MGKQLRDDAVVYLDAMSTASDRLSIIQSMVKTEGEVKALRNLLSLTVEYLTYLNLILIKSNEELEEDQFRVNLVLGEVSSFIKDIYDLSVTVETEKLNKITRVLNRA